MYAECSTSNVGPMRVSKYAAYLDKLTERVFGVARQSELLDEVILHLNELSSLKLSNNLNPDSPKKIFLSPRSPSPTSGRMCGQKHKQKNNGELRLRNYPTRKLGVH